LSSWRTIAQLRLTSGNQKNLIELWGQLLDDAKVT